MDWISGMQNAINYIEEHLMDELDYEEAAKHCYSSSYHFQRTFSILCGYTLGEYIRNRRLTLAGIELQAEKAKVIDVALKYGYDSPDSFAKAFRNFHGILPSQARSGGTLKSFSRLAIKVILEGGIMNYRIEQKPAINLLGIKRHCTGNIEERYEQESQFYISTREEQYVLEGLAKDLDTTYCVYTNYSDDGYDNYIATKVLQYNWDHLDWVLDSKEKAKKYERLTIPEGLYLVCETERCKFPTKLVPELRREAVSGFIPSSDYQLRNAPEIAVSHWYYKEGDEEYNSTRYIEIWLPIEKK